MPDINALISKAKIAVMANDALAFFASVLLSLRLKVTTDIPTAATNGLDLLINPDFFLSLKPTERDFLLMHETYHVVLQHMLRIGTRDPRMWNMACDYAINADLIKIGMKMPEKGLYKKEYAGLSADEIYEKIVNDPEEKNMPLPMEDLLAPESGQGGGVQPEEQISQAINDILLQAEIQARSAGERAMGAIPAAIQRQLEQMKNPKLPWHRLLQRYLFSYDKSEYTFRKTNRRYMPHILPTRFGEALDHVTVVIDTSGSVSKAQFDHFISEAFSLMKKMRPKKITLVQFSYGITAVDVVTTQEDFKRVQFKGGGGTNFQGVCDWVGEHKPKIVVVFTDGYFSDPKRRDTASWLWVINDNPSLEMPWGTTIHFDPPEDL